MAIDRRRFLHLAAIAPAIAAVPGPSFGSSLGLASNLDWGPATGSKSGRDLRRLIAATASRQFVGFDGWHVLWTGWKTAWDSIEAAHQWVMRPIQPFGIFAAEPGCAFYISMPGAEGFLHRGEVMCMNYRWQQVGYGLDAVFRKFESPQDVLANAQGVTARLTLEIMRGAIDFEHASRKTWEIVTPQWRWERLSGQSQFYLDADRYLRERFDLNIGTEPGKARETGEKLMLALYGAKRPVPVMLPGIAGRPDS